MVVLSAPFVALLAAGVATLYVSSQVPSAKVEGLSKIEGLRARSLSKIGKD